MVLLYKLTNCPLGQTGLDEKCYVILTVFVIITRKWTAELDLPQRPTILYSTPALLCLENYHQTESGLFETPGSDLDDQKIECCVRGSCFLLLVPVVAR